MFKIKICGVKTIVDAQILINAGADAIGLNFYEPSPRSITLADAHEIVQAIAGRLKTVGVFVNSSSDEISKLADELHLSAIQLHGDEPAEMLSDLPSGVPIIRAFRVGDKGLEPIARYVADCDTAGRIPDMALIDAASSVAYGGTGKQVDWERLRKDRHLLGVLPLVLAGGLKPTNVHAAIRIVQPDAVDTASGVEGSQGEKSAKLVDTFVANAKQAFEA